jgi:hypothetical protein
LGGEGFKKNSGPDGRGGMLDLTTSYRYDPTFNKLLSQTDAGGNHNDLHA